jgi:hypothetical protein
MTVVALISLGRAGRRVAQRPGKSRSTNASRTATFFRLVVHDLSGPEDHRRTVVDRVIET